MRNIEKQFTKYVNGTGAKIPSEVICDYAEHNPNAIINSLFKIINRELDKITGKESLDKVRELLKNINIIMMNTDGVNRNIVYRKLHKLDEKIDRIKRENRNQLIDISNAFNELEKFRSDLQKLFQETKENENNNYSLLEYLTDEEKNITYLEYAFTKMPFLLNSRDKDGNSFFYNTLSSYIESLIEENDSDTLYYDSVLSLLLSRKTLRINEKERKKCLNIIYSTIEKFSINKRQIKKNKKNIRQLENLRDSLKGMNNENKKIDAIASKYHIAIYFNQDLIEKAKLVRTPLDTKYSDREGVDEYIITIDGANACEIDDALSCRKLPNGNYLLGVHIASVLGYFPYESEIIEEAINRNHSIYLPRKYQTKNNDFNKTIPIFPYSFSADKASLLVKCPRLARSYFFEIDKEGNIVDEDFFKSIITSNKKTTYEEVNEVLEHGSNNKEFQNTVENLQIVTELLDNKYHATDLYEQVKESTVDYSDLRVKRVGAEKIVGQTMMLTGNRVAEYFANPHRGYPCLYRVHEVNEENTRKLEAMIENLTETYGGDQYQKLYQLIAGIYPKGWYATEGHHAGLGLEHYCHCTSALRRAADIVVEHALETCYDKEPTDKELYILEDEVRKRAEQINSKQDPIEWFIKDYRRAYQKPVK